MVASKYCFALVYQHNNEEFALSLKMRSQAVQVFVDIVVQRMLSVMEQRPITTPSKEVVSVEQVLQQHPVEVFLSQYHQFFESTKAETAPSWKQSVVEDMPELVKLTVEMGYEYVTISHDYFRQQYDLTPPSNQPALNRLLCTKSELYNWTVFALPQLIKMLAGLVHSSQAHIVHHMEQDFQHFLQHQQLTRLFSKHCAHLFQPQQDRKEL